MSNIKPEDRAYCAGLFEGEGSIVYTNGKSRGIQLSIHSIDEHPLALFCELMGFGTVRGPYQRRTFNNLPIYKFDIVGYEKVQYAICQLWFWLSPRRKEQVIKALRGYQNHEMRRNRAK